MENQIFRISLVVGPLSSENVIPLALPVIGGFLRSRGYQVRCWDFNIDFRTELKSKIQLEFLKMENWYGWTLAQPVVHEVNKFVYEWAKKIVEDKPHVVGFSTHITSAYTNLAIANAIKNIDPSIVTVFGGPECSYSWKSIIEKPEVDYVILGDGEYPFADLLDSILWQNSNSLPSSVIVKGSQKKNHSPAVNVQFESLPLPDYSSLDIRKYQRDGSTELPIFGSVGCTHHCTFCSRKFLHGSYRHKSSSRIISEIENCLKNYGVSKFYFVDSLINADLNHLHTWTSDVCNRKLKITWRANAVFRSGMSLDLLQTMHESGCNSINYGLESASPRVLMDMRKYSNIDIIEKIIQTTHDIGIRVTCFIILGYPIETKNDYEQTLEFLTRNKKYIDAVMVNTCYVGPGTILEENKGKYNIYGNGDTWYNNLSNSVDRKLKYDQVTNLLKETSVPIIELN